MRRRLHAIIVCKGAGYAMGTRVIVLLAAAAGLAVAGDWNPRAAADLEARQKAWIAWPTALNDGVPYISCHTCVPYLPAGPAPSRALGDGAPLYEEALPDVVRHGLAKKGPAESAPLGVKPVLAALLLVSNDAGKSALSPATEQALDRMWTLQIASGNDVGSGTGSGWTWIRGRTRNLRFTASLAARPEIGGHLEALRPYLMAQQGGCGRRTIGC